MNLEQLTTLNRYEIPAHIEAVDARLTDGMTEKEIADLEYEFRVVYTLDAVTKSRAHFQFVLPDSAEGKEIRNVLVQHKLADHLYPPQAGRGCFPSSSENWKDFHLPTIILRHGENSRCGPAKEPLSQRTPNGIFCVYHAAHRDYTYSDQWIELLVLEVNDDQKFADLKDVRI